MEAIFTQIENSLFSHIHSRTIKICLKNKHGNKVILTEKPGKVTFVSFIGNLNDIFIIYWYEKIMKWKKDLDFRKLQQ